MTTIKDIANKLGVAVSTVSYSLNDDYRIPTDTKIRVLAAAKELGYNGRSGRKAIATAPKTYAPNRKKTFAICLNTIEGMVLSELIKPMYSAFNINDCNLCLFLGKSIHCINWCDGLIIINSHVSNEAIERYASEHSVPIIVMDREIKSDTVISITADNFDGQYQLTQHLINNGCKTFTYVAGPTDSFESEERYKGFVQALTTNNIDSSGVPVLRGNFTTESGKNLARYFTETKQLPDAIICANDEMALGVSNALQQTKLNTSKLSIGGFDGNMDTHSIPYNFCTCKVDLKDWGTVVAETMLQALTTHKLSYLRSRKMAITLMNKI